MKKRLLSLMLVISICLSSAFFGVGAQAESFTVYVVSTLAKAYKKPSTSSGAMGTMAYGEQLTCLGYNSSWVAVTNKSGAIGYCRRADLSIKNPNSLHIKAYVKGSDVPAYVKPDSSSRVMARLNQSHSFYCVAITPDKQWARLQNGKYFGYVRVNQLSTAPVSAETSPSEGRLDVYIAANTVTFYAAASTSAKVLGKMSYGEELTLLTLSGDWARVTNDSGAIGYCKRAGLTQTNPNHSPTTIFINADGVSAYRKPLTSSGVMAKLKKNTQLSLVATTPDGNWCRLQNGKYYGYVQRKYISLAPEEKEPEAETIYVIVDSVNLYESPNTSAKKLETRCFGEALSLLGVEDGWAKLQLSGGKYAYCAYGALTRIDPNALRLPRYASKKDMPLYAQPDTSAKVLQTVPVNASLMVVAQSESGEWARVLLNGSLYAYVPMAWLSEQRVAEDDSRILDVTPRDVYIAATNLQFYASNNSSAKPLGTLSFGERLRLTGEGGGWARVANDAGSVGYCESSELTDADPNRYNTALYAQRDGVKVYAKADSSAKQLASLNLNARVTGVNISEDKAWVRIESGGSYGYVEALYLATSIIQNPAETTQMRKIVDLAMQQQGIRYKYAAQTPSDGFDCSGFTYYVFKNAVGISLKRTAYTQGYNDAYLKIDKRTDLRVGDLVFFNTVQDDDLCDHVGIYLGSNKFIHASSGAGKVVVSSLGSSESDYYYRTWSWGRRILK